MATRSFITTAEQDAAIAWRVAQLNAQGERITEGQLIAGFAGAALVSLVNDYRDAEASKVFEAFKAAPLEDRATVKGTLKIDV